MTAERNNKEVNEVKGGRLHLVFDPGLTVTTIFHEVYDQDKNVTRILHEEELINPVGNSFAVDIGDTVAFKVQNGNQIEAVCVQNYRKRPTKEPGAFIYSADLSTEPMTKKPIAKLSSKNEEVKIEGMGVARWRERIE